MLNSTWLHCSRLRLSRGDVDHLLNSTWLHCYHIDARFRSRCFDNWLALLHRLWRFTHDLCFDLLGHLYIVSWLCHVVSWLNVS